ncbi:MAG: hypothetical protein IK081_13340 [Lachnospiraceae bacterium]|nr:hypothetical protein [Lachnospiraceae bacterium]
MCKRENKIIYNKHGESGEVMLEGVIIMTITIFILIWLMGMAFLYYQRYVTTIVTNDAAVKVAATYTNPTSDLVMGYVSSEDISNKDLFRSLVESFATPGSTAAVNKDRARSYILYMLNRVNFNGIIQDVTVDMNVVNDTMSRSHIVITSTCEFKTPLGDVFSMFGLSRTQKYQVVSTAEYLDFSEFASTLGTAKYFENLGPLGNNKLVKSATKLIKSITTYYNKIRTAIG